MLDKLRNEYIENLSNDKSYTFIEMVYNGDTKIISPQLFTKKFNLNESEIDDFNNDIIKYLISIVKITSNPDEKLFTLDYLKYDKSEITKKLLMKITALSTYIAAKGRRGPARCVILNEKLFNYFDKNELITNNTIENMDVIFSDFIPVDEIVLFRSDEYCLELKHNRNERLVKIKKLKNLLNNKEYKTYVKWEIINSDENIQKMKIINL